MRHRLSMLIIVFVAFTLRIHRLGYQSIWWDEGRNIHVSIPPLPSIFTPWMDIHPRFYFYALHWWLQVAGQSEFAVRFLSVIFSLLTVALLFHLGRQLFDDNVGLVTGLISAISPLFIHEAQEARMYSMVILFSTISLIFFRQAWLEGRWHLWCGYVLATTASLYTHYAAFFILLAQNLVALGFIVASNRRRRALLSWLSSQAAVGILYLPQLSRALMRTISYTNPNLIPPSLSEFAGQTWQAFNTDLNVDAAMVAPFLLAIGLVVALGTLARLLDRRTDNLPSLCLALITFLVPLVVYYLILQEKPMFHPRYAMIATPAYFLLLACSIEALWRRAKALGLIGGGVVISALLLGTHSYYFNPTYFRDDTRSLALFVEQQATSDDIVILDSEHPFEYYYRGLAPARYLPADARTIAQTLTTFSQGKSIAYLVQWYKADSDPRGIVPFLLAKYGSLLGEAQFRGYRLSWYRLPPSPQFFLTHEIDRAEVDFGGALALAEYDFGGRGQGETSAEAEVTQPLVPAGKSVWVTLNWRLLADVGEDHKASLYLEDAAGHLVGQDDHLIVSDFHVRTSNWEVGEEALNVYLVLVAPGTPPGNYRLKVSTYKVSTLQRLEALAEGKVIGDSFELGTISVIRPATPPSVSTLRIQHPYPWDLQSIGLLGYDLPNASVKPGGRLTVTLYWQAKEDIDNDYLVHISLEDEKGTVWGQIRSRPGLGNYPTHQWENAEVVKDWHDLRASPQAPPKGLRLMLSLIDSVTEEESPKAQLTTITVEGRERLFTAPPMDYPLEWQLGQEVRLLGYNLDAESLHPGGSTTLVLFWQALGEMDTSYTVFAHLLDSENRIWGQKDNLPCDGVAPTSGWVEGEVVTDQYEVLLDPKAPEGQYVLEVGMYEAENGKRLPVLDASGQETGDRIILTTIQVSGR